MADHQWECRAARDLPIVQDDSWDGSAAGKKLLDHAGIGGEKPDYAFAARSFMFVDAANKNERGAYKDPFCLIVDGQLKASTGAIAEKPRFIAMTDVPQAVKDKAMEIVNAYQKRIDAEKKSSGDVYETRGGIPVEIRAEADGIKVSGYAAVFNQVTDIAGLFREKIAPGAFRSAIGRDDVQFLINHDGLPIARTKSGTLTLSEDSHGLRIESTLDPTDPDVARIVPKMKRGDLNKMSFAFRATRQAWDESGDTPLRTIQEAELYDVSIVNDPAYSGTDIGLRSLEKHREDQRTQNFQAASMRIRLGKNLDMKVRSKAR